MVGPCGGLVRAVVAPLAAVAISATVILALFLGSAFAAVPEYEYLKSFGPDGSESTAFAKPGPTAVDQASGAVYVLDQEVGKLYKFGSDGAPLNWGGAAPYLSGNELTGLVPATHAGENQVAVDSVTHKIYVTSSNSVTAFQADGEPSTFTAGPWAGTNAIGGFTELTGLAVDANGDIYASDFSGGTSSGGAISIYAPSGELITSFETSTPANLAVDSNGAIYVTRYHSTVLQFTPSAPPPVTSTTSYSPASEPLDSEPSLTVAVDPETDEVYVAQLFNPKIVVYGENGGLITSFAGEGSEGEVSQPEGVAVKSGALPTVYIGDNRGASPLSQVRVFKLHLVEPESPVIDQLLVGEVSSTAATLRARIDPNLKATSYHFEYGLAACKASLCTNASAVGASVGAGEDSVPVTQALEGLAPQTTYHYRLVAENELGSAEAEGTFSTQSNDLEFKLSDRRGWEMVSPATKRGALLAGSASGEIQAAADGEGVAYLSNAPIEENPEGARHQATSVLAHRLPDGAGWHSEDISPPNAEVIPATAGAMGEYKLFSADLSHALLEPRSRTLLSPEASERTPYLRNNTVPPTYKPLVTGKEGFADVPVGTEFGSAIANPFDAFSAVRIQNATPDLGHVVLKSSVPLACYEVAAGTGGWNDSECSEENTQQEGDWEKAPGGAAYEWEGGQSHSVLHPITVLPDDEGGGIVTGNSGSFSDPSMGGVEDAGSSQRHAISDDGSRVFWTGPDPGNTPNHLYLRDTLLATTARTARLDVPQQGASGAGNQDPVFQDASADGSVVFFTDEQQLTEGASPDGSDLYRCTIVDAAAGCASLIDLTAPLMGSGESAEVLGVISALSEDGARAYFVAKGALDPGENQFGHTAESGEPNLYLWQSGEGIRFIAPLSTEDYSDWGSVQKRLAATQNLSASSSPDGRYFAFMSQRNLTSSNPSARNLDFSGGEPVEEVYRYDAQADQLECVSCPPTGVEPDGTVVGDGNQLADPRGLWSGAAAAATVPEADISTIGFAEGLALYRPRAVLDNGRVFFNAIDSLVPADSNGQWDVYQYEDLGVGDCAASSGTASISRSAGGCVALISSGTAEGEAGFLDASESGNDVFFLTPAQLNEPDQDHELDVYDARVDGVPARLPQRSECLGEACQAPPRPPNDATPASAAFQGAGNVPPKRPRRCAKGKRRKRPPRCTSKHRKRHHHHSRTGRGNHR